MVVETIPIVDFAEFKTNPKKVAQDVFDACKSIGFFYMINHEIPEQDIDKAFALVSSVHSSGWALLIALLRDHNRASNSLICLVRKRKST